jgi:hypothetical protein
MATEMGINNIATGKGNSKVMRARKEKLCTERRDVPDFSVLLTIRSVDKWYH